MKKKKLWMVFSLLFLTLIGSFWYSNKGLTVTRYEVTDEKIAEEIRMVLLSDFHNQKFGNDNQKLVQMVTEEQPDVILCVGDFVTNDEADILRAKALIRQLTEIAPVYFSYGNHEIAHEMNFGTDLYKEFEACGAMALEFDYADVTVKGQSIRLAGLYGYALPWKYASTGEVRENECSFIDEFLDTDAYTLLMCHMPYTWLELDGLEEWDIDLVVSGHAHGGQIRIPFIGGMYAPDQGWFPEDVAGQFESVDGEATIIVSRGLGSSTLIPRWNNVPEVVSIMLKSE